MRKIHFASVSIAIVIWWAIAEYGSIAKVLLPSPGEVFNSLKTILLSDSGFKHTSFTLYRTIVSFSIGIIIAIPLGIFFGIQKKLYGFFEWIIEFFRCVPASAMYPIFLIFLGFGDGAKIAMGAWGGGLVVFINTIHGVNNAKNSRKVMAMTKHASFWQILRKITFFEALPFIFVGLRTGIAWNMIVIIVAEMLIGTKYGLGRLIYDASIIFDTASVISGIFLIGLIGYSINKIIVYFETRMIHWKGH
ncbi:ABC transporter permease [Candidatus Woesearchaeota archaeon]|nr:ABC transporter permease [Candidatus Woesearchaeota archaeon]